jgi:hypothetical protein
MDLRNATRHEESRVCHNSPESESWRLAGLDAAMHEPEPGSLAGRRRQLDYLSGLLEEAGRKTACPEAGTIRCARASKIAREHP